MLAQNDLGHLPNTSTICTTIISNAQKHSIPTVMYPVCFSSSAPALWPFLLHRTTHDCYPITAVFLQFYLPRATASSDFFKQFSAAAISGGARHLMQWRRISNFFFLHKQIISNQNLQKSYHNNFLRTTKYTELKKT